MLTSCPAPPVGAGAFARAAPPSAKYLPFDAAGLAANGAIAGYASLFGLSDLAGDVVLPGAFSESLARRGAAGIRMLFQHDPAQPVGVWKAIREDARGLYVEGQLTLDSARVRDLYALVKAGALDGLSIGFRTVTSARSGRTGPRHLSTIDLWEISLVTFPMLPAARLATVKTAHPQPRASTPLGRLTAAIRAAT